MDCFRILPSPLGPLYIAGDGACITGLWIQGQKYFPKDIRERCTEQDLPLFQAAEGYLNAYFAGKAPKAHGLPLAPRGTDFQKAVWQSLCAIPYGECRSYGAIAESMGCASPRAVGSAIGKNPISILIPCHRVLGKDGKLSGYAGGLLNKEKLLRLERISSFRF